MLRFFYIYLDNRYKLLIKSINNTYMVIIKILILYIFKIELKNIDTIYQ